MNTAREQSAASFAELLDLADCEDESELAELLTDHLDPQGVTGHIIDVVEYDKWLLRIPGHSATAISFPTSLAWVEEAAADLLRETLQGTVPVAPGATAGFPISDRTVLEAASWRLASALLRRHPRRLRLIRAHPGGGQSDCLWLLPTDSACGDLRLNRNGGIRVLERFDRRPAPTSESLPWADYLATEHRSYLQKLERQAGLTAPATTPAVTPVSLTIRVLAALATIGFKSGQPVDIRPGYIDTAGYGYGSGPNEDAFAAFPHIAPGLRRAQLGDFYGEPGYRFWFLMRSDTPVLAFEQSHALTWNLFEREPAKLLDLYVDRDRDATLTAVAVLERAVGHRR